MTTTASPPECRPAEPPLPVVPLPDPERLPADLRNCKAWIAWRAVWKWSNDRNAWKLNKEPCDPHTGVTHDMTDKEIRGDIHSTLAAVKELRRRRGEQFGIGITFCAVTSFYGLDLDGDLADGPSERLRWLMQNHPTWGEASVSGTGVHLFYLGSAKGKTLSPWRGANLEVFGNKGFIAMTGNVLDATFSRLADGMGLLAAIREEQAAEKSPTTSNNGESPKAKTPHSEESGDKPTPERVALALKQVYDADSHGHWIEIGQALHDWDSQQGYQLWLDWSRQSNKYDEADCLKRWRSFTAGGGITIATIFREALDNGWQPTPTVLLNGKRMDGKRQNEKPADENPTGEKSADRNETPPKSGWLWNAIDSAQFIKTDYRAEWLVKRMLVALQPAVLAGMEKTLKTTIAIDLAVSLAAKVPFLNRFEVYHKQRVAIFSGESGPYTLQETFRRIAAAKSIEPADCDILWGFDLPSMADKVDVAEVADGIRKHAVKVIIIDPAYLAALRGMDPNDAKNFFAMGPILKDFSEACIKAGCTPLIVHHANRTLEPGKVMELHHLSYSGFSHYARQWFLLSRMKAYEGDGKHRLALNAGGSCGQGGLYAVGIDEATIGDDFTGRKWEVMVEGAGEFRQRAEEEKAEAKRRKAEQKQVQKDKDAAEKLEKESHTVYGKFLKQPGEEGTARQVREILGWSGTRFNRALERLLASGRLKPAKVTCSTGRGGKKQRKVDGYKVHHGGDHE